MKFRKNLYSLVICMIFRSCNPRGPLKKWHICKKECVIYTRKEEDKAFNLNIHTHTRNTYTHYTHMYTHFINMLKAHCIWFATFLKTFALRTTIDFVKPVLTTSVTRILYYYSVVSSCSLSQCQFIFRFKNNLYSCTRSISN